jgi:hypothetical protein
MQFFPVLLAITNVDYVVIGEIWIKTFEFDKYDTQNGNIMKQNTS